MKGRVLEPPVHWWACPSCPARDRTQRSDIHTRTHCCPAHNGLEVLLVEVSGPDAKPDVKRVVEYSQDYSYGKREGPTGFHTYHGDGRVDAHVFAPVAASETAALAPGGRVSKPPIGATFYCWFDK